MSSRPILHLALPTPLRHGFDYSLPESFPIERANLPPGIRIQVPFGNQTLVGVLLEVRAHSETAPDKLRPAHGILDSRPVIPAPIMDLCRWCSEYYHYPLGLVLQAALPPRLRSATAFAASKPIRAWRHTREGRGLPETALGRARKQQALHQFLLRHEQADEPRLRDHGFNLNIIKALRDKGIIEPVEVASAAPADATGSTTPSGSADLLGEKPLELNAEQAAAYGQLHYHHFGCYLLDGATGSGKTEVYLHAINHVLQAGKQALVLVPEIGLTPQTLTRIAQRFRVPIAELHSGVAEVKRAEYWQAAASGHARVVVGTRLAVLTPMPDLGLIIVDEEHDLSFKQQDGLRYSARDLAVVRANRAQVPVVLGSATPSLESLYNARRGRYHYLRMVQRAGRAQLPALEVIDLREQQLVAGLAPQSHEAVRETLAQGQQALVFLNRRGYAPLLLCHHCGWVAECRKCDARLTLHQTQRHLRCHHCDLRRPVPRQCPQCHSQALLDQGQGTEKVEECLAAAFPDIPLLRVDRDTMARKGAMKAVRSRLEEGAPSILVGTQMLAKGHHFPHVSLVVVMDVDQGLMSADFRAAERMGQLLTQVSGRAGRSTLPGRVLIQSHRPEHPLLQLLVDQGYHRYADHLLQERRLAALPPMSAMALLRAESKRAENAVEFLQLARQLAQSIGQADAVTLIGPVPAMMERRQGRFRYQLQISTKSRSALHRLLANLVEGLDQQALGKRTRWSLDVDPLDLS